MNDNSYDAIIIHDPENEDVNLTGETRCPTCEEALFPDMTQQVFNDALDAGIAADIDCPECDTSLEFVINPLPTAELGFGLLLRRQ
jgi:hypothetical protein